MFNSYYEKVAQKTVKIDKDIPFDIPSNWQWVRLSEITNTISAGGDRPDVFSKIKTEQCQIPIFSNGIESDGLYGYTNTAKIYDRSITVSARGTIGFSCIRNEPYVPIVRLISVVPNVNISLDYLYIFFSGAMESGDGTSTPQLTVPNIKQKFIALPPREEQDRIVRIVNTATGIIKKIAVFQNDLFELCSQLKSAILAVFFGENSRYKSYYENEQKLGEILKYEQPAKYIVNSTNYSDDFATPVLTPGKTFILGYTNEKEGIYHVNGEKVIIFDDFTTASRLVDFNFKVKSSAMKILTISNQELFDVEYMYLLLQTIHVNNNTHKRYWISNFATRKVKIHTIQEQTLIVKEIKRLYSIIEKVVG